MIGWFRKARAAKRAAVDEMIRFNSPYCPRCGKSQVDMPDSAVSYELQGTYVEAMLLRCDSCGKISGWVDIGFMGIRAPLMGFKEYQTKEARQE